MKIYTNTYRHSGKTTTPSTPQPIIAFLSVPVAQYKLYDTY